jgi:chromosome segregation ATPase
MTQLRDQEEAAQRTLDGESRQRVAMAEKVAAAQKEAQQAIGEAEHQSKLREQASAEVSRLQAALSDVQGALSTRTEQLQSLESRRQRELQQEAEQTAKAQAAAQSAAARSDWLQEQVSALKAERTTLEGKLESAFNAQREARSQVGSTTHGTRAARRRVARTGKSRRGECTGSGGLAERVESGQARSLHSQRLALTNVRRASS